VQNDQFLQAQIDLDSSITSFACIQLFFIHMLTDVPRDLNVLNKTFQTKNIDLMDVRIVIEITTQSLSRKFLVDEEDEFGANTKFMAHFLKIFEGDEIDYQNSMGMVYFHCLHHACLMQ
jgi:hypothetical protein